MPTWVGLQLTTRCDRACSHCFIERRARDIAVDACREVAGYAGLLGDARVAFTGGEPTLHPRFAEIVDLFATRGLRLSMVTNGWGYGRVHPVLRAHARSLDLLSFSLDGATATAHDEVRGRGSFDRVMEAVALCRCDGLPFGLRMTVTRSNLAEVGAMAALAHGERAAEVTFIPALPTPRLAASGRVLGPEDLAELLHVATVLGSSAAVPVRLAAGCFSAEVLRPCPTFAMQTLFVTADGRLRFCCHLPEGDGPGSGGDLGQLGIVPVAALHRRWMEQVTRVIEDKSGRQAAGTLSWAEHHPCWYCLKRFGRVDWMREAAVGAWADDLRRQPIAGAEHVRA